MNIAAQIIGFLAMFFSVFSFQMNKHKHIMIMQILATSLFGLQYLMLGAYTGMAVDAVATIRGIVFFNKDKKWAQSRLWIAVFACMFIISGILAWQGTASILVTLAMVLNTFSFSFTKPKLVRSTILISSPLMLIYDILTMSIGGIINEICVTIRSYMKIPLPAIRRAE